jgi:hypothetical protein
MRGEVIAARAGSGMAAVALPPQIAIPLPDAFSRTWDGSYLRYYGQRRSCSSTSFSRASVGPKSVRRAVTNKRSLLTHGDMRRTRRRPPRVLIGHLWSIVESPRSGCATGILLKTVPAGPVVQARAERARRPRSEMDKGQKQ